MATADQLVEQMFSWMEQREECSNKLEKLAGELESLRTISRPLGIVIAVFGSLFVIAAVVATVYTGRVVVLLISGVAIPVAVFGISLITKHYKHLQESNTTKDAKKVETKASEITERIQRLFQQLKEECEKAKPNADHDAQDLHLMIEIVGAIAKQSGLKPCFIKDIFNHHFAGGVPGTIDVNMISFQPVLVGLAGVLTLFSLEARGEQSKILFAEGAEQMIKIVSEAGILEVFRKIFLAVDEATGWAFELPEAIKHWRNLMENNNVTEVSKSLRDTADALRQLNSTLRAQLDKIKKLLEKLDQLKCYIENGNRTSEEKENFIGILQEICHDKEILNSLKTTDDTEVFIKLVVIFHLLKQELDMKKKKTDQEDIDIIFVAHGEIQEPLIPARTLLPLSTIEDVILYSPWNCAIDADVAYGIATGNLQTQHRIFGCGDDDCCSDDDRHQPNTLPPNWNSMKNAGGSEIPNILVSPLKHPVDCAWKRFLWLQGQLGGPGRNRVVIPYIIAGYDDDDDDDLMTVPFCVVTLALSLVLFIFPFTARVHLAACLCRSCKKTLTEQSKYLEQQYSWTIDETYMTAKTEDLKRYPELYKALRAVFDR